MSQSVYEQLGGFSEVRKIVSEFYDRVLEEDEVARFFQNTDMASLIDHQTKFWATILGGPVSYSEEQLTAVHANMGVEDDHFDLVCELVVETLEDHDVAPDQIERIAKTLRDYRFAIVVKRTDG